MKIQVVKIGRPVAKEYTQLVSIFEKRLRPFAKVEQIEVKASGGVEKSTKSLLAQLGVSSTHPQPSTTDVIVALDERGENWSSPELASRIQKWSDDPRVKTLTFVIGGPYGLSDEVKAAANALWSLSRAVMPSDLAWLVVWEQLYRASTIIRGTGYHHE